MNIKISDIAKHAGVSAGTVDRVLHNRGKVSVDKQMKVEKALKELNYKPNMIARFLASKKQYVITVIIPTVQEGNYWELVSNGIKQAVGELENFNISLDFVYYNQENVADMETIYNNPALLESDAVLMATHFYEQTLQLTKKFEEENIPYVFIDINIPEQKHMAYFGVDTKASGEVAARLMLKEVGEAGHIILVKNNKLENSVQANKREKGFLATLEKTAFQGKIYYLNSANLSLPETTHFLEKITEVSREKPIGMVVFNSQIYQLVHFVDKSEQGSRFKLLGYDAIPQNAAALKAGKVEYIISQHPEKQGYKGITVLANFLLFGTVPEKINFMSIDILIKENIDFIER